VIGKVELTAGADQLVADGTSQVRITAEVLDTDGNRVPDGRVVTFTVTAGDIDKNQAGTQNSVTASTSGGFAYAYLTSPVRIGICTVTGTSDGVSGTIQVSFIPGPLTAVSLSPSPSSLVADGVSQSKIRVKALDANGNEISGEVITLSMSAGTGTLSSATVTTAQGGVEVTYTASTTIGVETVKAEATNGVTASCDIALVQAVVGSIVLAAKSQTIIAGGTSSTEITALVNDENGNPITSPTVVSFSTTAGLLSASNATTSAGKASVNLISATKIGFATVTATAGGASANVTVTFIAGPPSAINLSANPNNLTAGSSVTSTIRALVVDAFANPVADGHVISFSITTGGGVLSALTDETSGGFASVTYTPSASPGLVRIKAEATNGAFGTADINLITPTVGSVTLAVGSPTLTANGTSGTPVIATVLDNVGNPITDGTTVSFTTTAGTLSSATATTSLGNAQVTLFSPTLVGTATVTATAGGRSGTATVTFIPGAISSIALTANPNNLSADGTSTSVIRAQVTDAQGNAVSDGEVISFSIIGSGTLSSPTAETKGGAASVNYTAPNQEGTAIVRATATNGIFSSTTITLIRASVGSITIASVSPSIIANGTSNTTIRATVKDTSGNNIADGTLVSFTTSAGSLSSPTATTTNGVASVTLFSATIVGSAKVTAASGGATASVTVQFVPGPASTLALTASPNNIRADRTSTSTLRASARDAHGNAVADGEVISFDVQVGSGTLSSPTATTSGGVATVTYTASGTEGTETVRARATSGISATTNIILISAMVGSVEVTAGSAKLPADGSTTTQIRALVKDANGSLVNDGTPVSFTTTAGSLSSATANTSVGVATVTLRSSAIIGKAVVRATAGGISGEVEVEFVAGAIASLSLTAIPNNLTADGSSTSTVTALASDGRGNPAADGEIISFFLSGPGSISAASATTSGGYASITYKTSQTPGTAFISARAVSGVSGSTLITVIAAAVKTVTVTAGSSSIPADGTSTTVITAEVKDTNGNNVADGTIVSFTTTHGVFTLSGTTTATASTGGGVANVILRSATIAATAKVKATAGGVSGETNVVFAAVSDVLSLSTSQTSVKSDNSDSATITATVLDANKVPVSGATVLFTATGGQISATSVETDANGQAKILFSSGTVEKKNQIVTITATVQGLASKQIPIQITGTTITLTTNATNLEVGGSAATLTATLKDAGGVAIFDADLTFSIVAGSTGAVTFSQTTAKTDVAGQVTVTVTGTAAGSVTVRADSLGASATIAYAVSITGQAFGIISPTADPHGAYTEAETISNQIAFADANPDTITRSDAGSFITDGFVAGQQILVSGAGTSGNNGAFTIASISADGKTLTLSGTDALTTEGAGANVTIISGVLIVVQAPTQANVRFATTLGEWDNSLGTKVLNKAVASGQASAFLSSEDAGVATVQVSDADNAGTSDSITIAFSAPPVQASQIALQASATVVAPSTGTTKNTVTLTATVKNTLDQVVGGAPVAFSIKNPTGGGESVSPVIVYTNDFGVAQSTFTSGSLSSGGEGVTVEAEVVGTGIKDDVQIVIGGTAGSVVIGRSTKIESTNNNTAYKLPMSVLVLDSNGNPVPGAIVSLGTWPVNYAVGGWAVNGSPPPPCIPTARYTAPATTSNQISFTENHPNPDTITRADGGSFITDGFLPGGAITVNGSAFNEGTYTISAVTTSAITLSATDDLNNEPAGNNVTLTSPSDVYPNEDVNRNLILDTTEDANGDGELTPPNSSSGAVPTSVTTEENGVATFDLIYLKAYAAWIETEITADVLVLGTETRSTLTFWLPFAEDEACDLPASPFTAP
jgi:adhesin/invasin